MKTRRLLSTSVGLSLRIAVVGAAVFSAISVLAASDASNMAVPVRGRVNGLPEAVGLSGTAQITSVLVTDPVFGTPPGVILSIDLQNVSAQGLLTGLPYVATSEQTVIRRLVAKDRIDLVFPFFPSGTGGTSSARSALWSFRLAFDVSTGAITRAKAKVKRPHFSTF